MIKPKGLVNLLVSSLFLAGLFVSVAEPTKADQYGFERFIGKVYVGKVNVDFADNGVTLSVAIHTPSCPNQYHVDGYVQVTYKNGDGFASRTWSFSGSDEENVDRNYSDFLPYRQIPGGTVNVKTSADCVYHGVRHGPIHLPF
ncbi:MAG: hypothetical protein EWV75_13295 [Microcystis wesenbergii Mw_QC_S_20081001_S30D]|jgi:hypothetical protein|uniref:Uncharacterized protein n=2 Tax=Microcystis TaxID=1125 RepID=A0A552JJN7_9CHRO|nr:hypothetical protein [Microcystis aeruginosa G11-04]NCT44203.1 hypothetical protein [Microcystis aeruginosa G11-09]TRU95694.1 MAG: hypothetical protein EWV75_13295 [Microcystis wesenbergii Mw_QC_S_20081001_S30D]TRV01005.1 MAG: hypothetical protein EWV74_11435 [Microcystis wesenbergii Mw_QC_S_20081001_S30]TRV04273.1 MAG: hypothetical protein EWV73_03150 [Microcystis wesenbergii Mw_QC_B_20070930_S4D]TRV08207.1 MAG: hypothetical protein EWV89_21050 [Microcystis wesenbergii Mw_QC_B_20070930_S4]